MIWVGTYGGGLDRLDPGTGKFIHFRHDPADPRSISNDYIRAICEVDPARCGSAHTEGPQRI